VRLVTRIMRALAPDRPAQGDRRPWAPGEPATILDCDRRTGRPRTAESAIRCSVVACDGELVTVVVGSGRKAVHEVFSAATGWDAYEPGDSTPWRLFHGRVR
jgi:hypothetical protein